MEKKDSFLAGLWAEPFKRNLIIALVFLGIALIYFSGDSSQTPEKNVEGIEFHFFHLTTCPHCKEQKVFNERLKVKYPSVRFIYHEVSGPKEAALMQKMALELGADRDSVPLSIFCGEYFTGYESDAATGAEIDKALGECLQGRKTQAAAKAGQNDPKKILLPLIGEINAAEYSLPALAVILGLVDGFNPCAMWVLVYMIGIALTLNDKRRIWLLVGSFVFASGVLYFLFMTAWLNAFLLLGFLRPVTILIGLAALYGGITSIREFVRTKGALVCDTTGAESKKKTMGKIESIIHSPITIATIVGIVALAFVVNSVEFVCSAAIPAVFTQVLALSGLAAWKHYLYILIYDIFFMLDDLIIFGLAAFAISSSYGEKYAKYCKIIGGILMFALGMLLLFAPDMLR